MKVYVCWHAIETCYRINAHFFWMSMNIGFKKLSCGVFFCANLLQFCVYDVMCKKLIKSCISEPSLIKNCIWSLPIENPPINRKLIYKPFTGSLYLPLTWIWDQFKSVTAENLTMSWNWAWILHQASIYRKTSMNQLHIIKWPKTFTCTPF